MDLSRAEDDEGWHTGIGNISIIPKIYSQLHRIQSEVFGRQTLAGRG
jgi:hypothetical protein